MGVVVIENGSVGGGSRVVDLGRARRVQCDTAELAADVQLRSAGASHTHEGIDEITRCRIATNTGNDDFEPALRSHHAQAQVVPLLVDAANNSLHLDPVGIQSPIRQILQVHFRGRGKIGRAQDFDG